MSQPELPESLHHLIRCCLPDFRTAELLVFLARQGPIACNIDEAIEALRPSQFRPALVTEYLDLFQRCGLVAAMDEGRFVYRPRTDELADAVTALVHAYDERPVSLIRAIYAAADSPIQSFADSFRLRGK